MRFRPLLSRNFNRRGWLGGREGKKGSRSRASHGHSECLQVVIQLFYGLPAVPLDLLDVPIDQPRTDLTVSRTYRIRSNRVRDEIIFCDKKRGIKKYKIVHATGLSLERDKLIDPGQLFENTQAWRYLTISWRGFEKNGMHDNFYLPHLFNFLIAIFEAGKSILSRDEK